MAKLNDKERKLIIADYIQSQNYSEVARKYNVSDMTVRRIVKDADVDVLGKVEQKETENTQDTLTYMTEQHEVKKRIIDKILNAMENKAENVDMFTNIKDLATAYGILIDKELKFHEVKQGNVKQEPIEIILKREPRGE